MVVEEYPERYDQWSNYKFNIDSLKPLYFLTRDNLCLWGEIQKIFKEIFESFRGNNSFKMALVLTSTLTSTNSFIVEECCEGMINDCWGISSDMINGCWGISGTIWSMIKL